MSVADVLRRATEAGVTFSISGADILIGGNVDYLDTDLRAWLHQLAVSGYLWDWSGAAAADAEAIEFSKSLGVEAVLVETESEAAAAASELIADASDGRVVGLDVETALKDEFRPPPAPILINGDGTLSERNRERKDKPGDPKPWRDPHMAQIKLLQLYAGGQRCFVFRDAALAMVLKSRFIRERPMVAHNASFETAFLRSEGIESTINCTLQAFGLLHGTMDRGLDRAANKMLGLNVPKALQVSDWAAKNLSRGQICYAASDAILAYRLWQKQQWMLDGNPRTYLLQRDAQPAVAAMEWRGMGFDKAGHTCQVETWNRDYAQACRSFTEATGKPPPIKRPELQGWIEEVATEEELAKWPRGKDGSLSVAADCIKWLILGDNPTVPIVLDIHARKKLIDSFGLNLHRFISPVTGRIHASFNIGKAETGRFSADTPNLQQLPSKGAGKSFRRCIVPEDGCALVCADFNQIELRIAAYIHRDYVMMRHFVDGKDVHAETVRLLGFNDVTPERRSLAKAINFGSIYGMSAAGLVEYAWSGFGLRMTEAEAQQHLDRFFAVYRGIRQGRFEVLRFAKASGWIPAGRYGRVVEKAWVQKWVERGKPPFTMCANFPISGSASDLMLAVIPAVERRLRHLRGGLILTVHDELVVEVHEDDAEAAKAILEEEMTRAFAEMFPGAPTNGVVAAKVGRDWLEAKG